MQSGNTLPTTIKNVRIRQRIIVCCFRMTGHVIDVILAGVGRGSVGCYVFTIERLRNDPTTAKFTKRPFELKQSMDISFGFYMDEYFVTVHGNSDKVCPGEGR